MTNCRFLYEHEFRKAEDDRRLLATSRGEDQEWLRTNKSTYGYASLWEVTGKGVMWYASWYYDPANPDHKKRRESALKAIEEGSFGRGERNYFLSRFYWQDWSDKRPPICVICPDGSEWCVDQKSSNGDGWRVTGEVPLITCHPSIQVSEYHGFLTNGIFSPPV